MDAVDIAWLAGIIEGEGTIRVRSKNAGIEIAVKMTDEDVVRKIHAVTGCGSVSGPVFPPGNRKPNWTWRCSTIRDASRLMLAVYPLMGLRRAGRIGEAAERMALRRRNPRSAAPCGTRRGYKRHLADGEQTCADCRRAEMDSQRRRKAAAKGGMCIPLF